MKPRLMSKEKEKMRRQSTHSKVSRCQIKDLNIIIFCLYINNSIKIFYSKCVCVYIYIYYRERERRIIYTRCMNFLFK